MPGKEGVLVMIEEIRNRSMSIAIMRRLDRGKSGSLIENSPHKANDNDFDVARVSY